MPERFENAFVTLFELGTAVKNLTLYFFNNLLVESVV
jgi:hypothetical protein